jgi:hypothetical protein
VTDSRLRPFAITGGRARAESDLPLETPITTLEGARSPATQGLMAAEHHEILHRCRTAQTVVELSSVMGTTVGVVRVLVLDLAERGLLQVHTTTSRLSPHRDIDLLEEVLDGIAHL